MRLFVARPCRADQHTAGIPEARLTLPLRGVSKPSKAKYTSEEAYIHDGVVHHEHSRMPGFAGLSESRALPRQNTAAVYAEM